MNEEDRKLGMLLADLKSREYILIGEIKVGKDLPFRNIAKSRTQLVELQLLISEVKEKLSHK